MEKTAPRFVPSSHFDSRRQQNPCRPCSKRCVELCTAVRTCHLSSCSRDHGGRGAHLHGCGRAALLAAEAMEVLASLFFWQNVVLFIFPRFRRLSHEVLPVDTGSQPGPVPPPPLQQRPLSAEPQGLEAVAASPGRRLGRGLSPVTAVRLRWVSRVGAVVGCAASVW